MARGGGEKAKIMLSMSLHDRGGEKGNFMSRFV